jgi:hypothetical protein
MPNFTQSAIEVNSSYVNDGIETHSIMLKIDAYILNAAPPMMVKLSGQRCLCTVFHENLPQVVDSTSLSCQETEQRDKRSTDEDCTTGLAGCEANTYHTTSQSQCCGLWSA